MITLRQEYGNLLTPQMEQFIINELRLTQAADDSYEALEKARQAQAELANIIGSSMEQSLMGIVDGTGSVKDAFRDMAADIIKHLYKVMVVQQMVNALGGFMGGSSNVAISGIGDALSSYDGGGYTGSGSRSGGLDGKGGFIAMMHPQETVVDHTKSKGKSGGAATYVTNNYSDYHISANTSDDTKRLITQTIQQAQPALTKKAVETMVDGRRRGGSMKSTFG